MINDINKIFKCVQRKSVLVDRKNKVVRPVKKIVVGRGDAMEIKTKQWSGTQQIMKKMFWFESIPWISTLNLIGITQGSGLTDSDIMASLRLWSALISATYGPKPE